MEITDVRLWTIDGDAVSGGVGGTPAGQSHPQNETFCVALETDAGHRGVAANRGGGAAACHLVDAYFRPLLEGADPLERERLWREMVDALPAARGGLTAMAVSGVDLALWDLHGKAAGEPVYDLLGGRVRESLPCYVTATHDAMEHVADEGFLGVKLPVSTPPESGRAGLRELEERVAAAREAWGPDAEVMIDCFMDWTREFTVRAADRLAPYDLRWIEDPIDADHTVDQYADLRERVGPTSLAVGNLEFSHRAIRRLIEGGAADVVQPDVQWVGGLTELVRMGATARGAGVPLIPHRGNVYSVHYALARHETPCLEYMLGSGTAVQPLQPALAGEPVPEDGHLTVGDDPGFGIELDTDVLQRFRGLA
jgi:L-alanine-DL-glutamate epimerase-like enolase superfamily enzyme